MTAKRTDFYVGLFVLAGAAALLFLALKVGNFSSVSLSSATYQVKARFDDIGGLKARAPVKSAGVVVGRVGAINFDNNSYQALVILNLDNRYKFPKDTSAKILTAGLLGEQYIGLEPGGDADSLTGGDRIISTQSAVVLENLISQFLFSKAAEGAPKDASAPADAPSAASSPSPAKPVAKAKP
jgi:phospholipid/cholesterol/gamma-HCH transport system substrate-binding protein